MRIGIMSDSPEDCNLDHPGLSNEIKEQIKIIFDECPDDAWETIEQKYRHRGKDFIGALKNIYIARAEFGDTKEEHISFILDAKKDLINRMEDELGFVLD